MKQIILSLICLLAIQVNIFADNDKPISIDKLPANARQFIEKYFPGNNVSYAKMESELFDKSYEVIFVDGSKVEFNKKGEWTDVNCKFSQIPAGIVPQKINDYVAANHKENKVTEIDRDSKDYEVKLNSGLELKFDLKFNLIGYDD